MRYTNNSNDRANDNNRGADEARGHGWRGGKPFETIRLNVPGPRRVGVRDLKPGDEARGIKPRDVLSVAELDAFASELSDLVDDARFSVISDQLTIDIERRQSARRRVGPRLRIAD